MKRLTKAVHKVALPPEQRTNVLKRWVAHHKRALRGEVSTAERQRLHAQLNLYEAMLAELTRERVTG